MLYYYDGLRPLVRQMKLEAVRHLPLLLPFLLDATTREASAEIVAVAAEILQALAEECWPRM